MLAAISKSAKNLLRLRKVGFVRFGSTYINSNMDALSCLSRLRSPFARLRMVVNTFVSRFIIGLDATVSFLLRRICSPQVVLSIVKSSIAIFVIYLESFWAANFAMHCNHAAARLISLGIKSSNAWGPMGDPIEPFYDWYVICINKCKLSLRQWNVCSGWTNWENNGPLHLRSFSESTFTRVMSFRHACIVYRPECTLQGGVL